MSKIPELTIFTTKSQNLRSFHIFHTLLGPRNCLISKFRTANNSRTGDRNTEISKSLNKNELTRLQWEIHRGQFASAKHGIPLPPSRPLRCRSNPIEYVLEAANQVRRRIWKSSGDLTRLRMCVFTPWINPNSRVPESWKTIRSDQNERRKKRDRFNATTLF